MSRTLLTPAQRRAIRGLQGKLDTLTEGEASRGRMEGKEDTRDWLLASFASDNDGSSFASVVMDEWTTHLHEICARLAKTNYGAYVLSLPRLQRATFPPLVQRRGDAAWFLTMRQKRCVVIGQRTRSGEGKHWKS